MSPERQAVFFNAVPLFVLAAAYLFVAGAVAPTLWRERSRIDLADLALALIFPCIAVPAAVYGALVLHDRKPIGAHVWPAFAATLVALVPSLLFLSRRRDRAGLLMSGPRAREAEELVTARGRGLEAVAAITNALTRTQDPVEAGRVLLDEVAGLLGVDFTALMLIAEDERAAVGLIARHEGADVEWWPTVTLDLYGEPSATASAFFSAAPVAIYDLETSLVGSRRMLEATGVKSGAWIPLITEDRVIGVLVAAPTDTRRAFSNDEVTLMQALASEAAIAIERTRSAAALDQALARERLVAEISRRVREVHDLDAVMRVTVTETGRALGASRCFIRLGGPGEPLPIRAEWFVKGLKPVGAQAEKLPVSNLAARERRTVAVDDVETAAELEDPLLGGRRTLLELGTKSVLATPLIVFDQMIGVLGVHRAEKSGWSEANRALLEAVAREAALAIHTAGLLEEGSRQARVERGFYRIASLLGEPISLSATIKALAQAASEALGGASAAVLMPAGDGLEFAGAHDAPPRLTQLLERGVRGDGQPLRAAARSRRTLAAAAVEGDERFDDEWQKVLRGIGYGALLAVPVEAPRGDQAGLVLVFFAEQRPFTDDDLELAQTLAGAARGALERSELFESERRARALAQQLARAAAALATELDPVAVLGEVVEQAPVLVGADAAMIRLLEGGELVVAAASAELDETDVRSHGAVTDWLAGDVLQSRAPVAIANAGEDARMSEADPLLASGYSAYLGVPLLGPEETLLGVLSVYARGPRSWREEEVEALVALGGTAASALSGAELYQRVALEKERSGAILANIADGIVAVDREGKVVLWNAAAERITGVPASEALGGTPLQVLQRELHSDDEAPSGDRLVAIRRGNEEVWLSLTEAIMRDPAGAVAGRIFAFRDISDERVVEQMKSEFVAAVSHTLRTPLTSIYGFAETLLRQDVLFGEEERATFLGFIASESERLTKIVDKLLTVARLDTRDLQVQVAPTDVGSVVSEAVAGAQESVAVNAHSFVLDLPAEPLTAAADAEKLRQILDSLVDNAIRYSPDGGTVTVTARRKGDTVEVRVEDEGIGIPEAEQRRIFAKFYRAETVARDPGAGGTGLGLFIARGLVAAMGGRIWVDSREGQGSSFAFELPASREPALSAHD